MGAVKSELISRLLGGLWILRGSRPAYEETTQVFCIPFTCPRLEDKRATERPVQHTSRQTRHILPKLTRSDKHFAKGGGIPVPHM